MENQTKQITDRFPNNQLVLTEQDGTVIITAHHDDIYPLCEFLKMTLQYDYLQFLTCIDRPEKMEMHYQLYSYTHQGTTIVKTDLPRSAGKIASVASIWKTADWHEREAFDLFGVIFAGHPALRRILLEDDFPGHPLLKDFSSNNMIRLPKV